MIIEVPQLLLKLPARTWVASEIFHPDPYVNGEFWESPGRYFHRWPLSKTDEIHLLHRAQIFDDLHTHLRFFAPQPEGFPHRTPAHSLIRMRRLTRQPY
ncbi:hypothetical protein AVEN_136365-1 [Araneus ventricosus]|uniref:Uncharacterized protein n=1 Tax=Araneus ventricosus TaxID=182803 RepID=A0A4Y2JH18_ARAVE|nr:hypothetical protein AVEN_136365-1 [Araneus ventricosus]